MGQTTSYSSRIFHLVNFSEKLKKLTETIMDFFQTNPAVAIAIAAFVAGVGLMYLVMRRTHERRNGSK